jgi:PHD/YefM family antitoxin component YafN of YafNO toxin-antitoxin module
VNLLLIWQRHAKSEDIDITKEEAEAYLDDLSEYELEDGELKYVAGGGFWDKLRKVPNKVAKSATDYN